MSGVTTDDGAPAVVQPAFAPGTVVAGRYRLESRLGAGGGGTVWRALDEKLGLIVAFKIVDADVDVERWRREVAMARRIADRNVCRVHDLGETSELRFVTMELVEGASLRSKCGPDLPAEEARSLFRQIVSGTAAIHAAGVVHRDLKPENIVVDTSGRAVIVDFGLAKEPRGVGVTQNMRATPAPTSAAQTVTSAGMVVGTPRYMSPEQAVGDTVDARTDVWALGLIGHELLTGAMPALDEAGRRVGDLAKWPHAAAVVRRCLAREPGDRFRDARELSAALVEKRGRGRISIALVAAIVATVAVVGVRKLVATEHAPAPKPAPVVTPKRDGISRVQLTTTPAAQWPMAAPVSVALSPDAARFAYTTAGGELFVRPLAGGEAKPWALPLVPSRFDASKSDPLVTAYAAGWYGDGALAVLGTSRAGEWRLYKVRDDGTSTLLHASSERFPIAVRADQALIAKRGQAVFAILPNEQLQQLATVGNGEDITALAISPDGTRVASLRVAGESSIHVAPIAGGTSDVVWRGADAGQVLMWLDDTRLAFATAGGLHVHDLRTKQTTAHPTDDAIAGGSAAAGIVLLVRGPANLGVYIGDKDGWPLQRLGPPEQPAHTLAGWTADGRLVFVLGDQLVRGSLAQGIEPWPNTKPAVDIPDAVVGPDVIAHHAEGTDTLLERIAADGTHTLLQRLPTRESPAVHCAFDRCILERVTGDQVSYTALDPTTGALGRTHHRRRARSPRSAALTPDGAYLAIAEGTNEVHLVTTADDTLRTIPTRDAAIIESLAFAHDNRLWLTARDWAGRPFGLARYFWGDKTHKISETGSGVTDKRAALHQFSQPTPNADGSQLAVVVRELRFEIARLDGL